MSAQFATTLFIQAHILYRNFHVVLVRTSSTDNASENGSDSHRRANVHFVRTISGHDQIIIYNLTI